MRVALDVDIEMKIEGAELVVALMGERGGTWGYGELSSSRILLTDLWKAMEVARETKRFGEAGEASREDAEGGE